MTRLPQEWAALLAISGGLMLAPGCSRTEPGQAMIAPPDSARSSTADESAAPQFFAPPTSASPLPMAATGGLRSAAATREQERDLQLDRPSLLVQHSGVDEHTSSAVAVPPPSSYAPSGYTPSIYEPNPRASAASVYDHAPRQPIEVASLPSGPELAPPQGIANSDVPAVGGHGGPATPAAPAAAPRPVVVVQPVGDQAVLKTRAAYRMAQRGMLFAARDEVTAALHMLAQALDVQHGTTAHSSALSAGLVALREAADFAPPPGRDAAAIRVGEIARTHRTPVLDGGAGLPPIVAQQHYYAFAQQQLAFAGGGQPAASQAFYTLGRIQGALASQPSAAPLHGPGAIVFHQAALAVDSRNYLAANELGVLLARYGQLAGARQALLHSVTTRPHAEGWHNLAIVHERLGEADLARLARGEQQLLARGTSPAPAASRSGQVQWVDAQTFASSSAADAAWPPPSTATAAAAPPNNNRR